MSPSVLRMYDNSGICPSGICPVLVCDHAGLVINKFSLIETAMCRCSFPSHRPTPRLASYPVRLQTPLSCAIAFRSATTFLATHLIETAMCRCSPRTTRGETVELFIQSTPPTRPPPPSLLRIATALGCLHSPFAVVRCRAAASTRRCLRP